MPIPWSSMSYRMNGLREEWLKIWGANNDMTCEGGGHRIRGGDDNDSPVCHTYDWKLHTYGNFKYSFCCKSQIEVASKE